MQWTGLIKHICLKVNKLYSTSTDEKAYDLNVERQGLQFFFNFFPLAYQKPQGFPVSSFSTST